MDEIYPMFGNLFINIQIAMILNFFFQISFSMYLHLEQQVFQRQLL